MRRLDNVNPHRSLLRFVRYQAHFIHGRGRMLIGFIQKKVQGKKILCERKIILTLPTNALIKDTIGPIN